MKFKLDLTKNCIETASKQAYNRSVSRYFKAAEAEKAELELIIDALVQFLEDSDFLSLRSRYPELRGGSDATVELEKLAGGAIGILCNGSLIE